MCGVEPAFPSFCHLLRSRHTSVTVWPCPSGVAHPPRSGQSRPFFVEDLDTDATRTSRRDRREPRCVAGRRIRVARRPRMLPTQSVLKPQPWTRAAHTPRRILPRTRDARALSSESRPCSAAARRKRPLLDELPHPRRRRRGRTRRNSRGRNP